MKLTNILNLCLILFMGAFSTGAHAATAQISDTKNMESIQNNKCIDVDFLTTYEPRIGPSSLYVDNIRTAEQMARILSILYGCDILAEESKRAPDDPYQDGVMYIVWSGFGKKGGRYKSMYDTIPPIFQLTINIREGEKVFSTFDDAIESERFKKVQEMWGPEKVFIQAFTIDGEDKGLFNVKGVNISKESISHKTKL